MSKQSEFPSKTLVAVTGTVFLLLLAAVLFPFSWGDGNPRRACMARLKQCGMATRIYTESNDGLLPPAATWMDSLTSVDVKDEVFACPDVRKENPSANGYAMNDALSLKPTTGFKEPDKTVLYFDSVLLGRNAHSAFGGMPDPPRYSGNCVGYLDGHAKRIARGR